MEFINAAEEKADQIAREANSATTLAAMAREVAEIEEWGSDGDPGSSFDGRMAHHFVDALNGNLENAISLHEKHFGQQPEN